MADAPDPTAMSRGIPLPVLVGGAISIMAVVLGGIWYYMANSDPVERARQLISEFKYPEAQELLLDYVKTDPNNEDAMFELAKLQWQAKAFGDAAVTFQNVVEINPTNVEAGLRAVLSLQLSGKSNSLDQEISILETLSDNAEDNAKVWLMLAMAKGARGEENDYAEQSLALERVLELSPGVESARLDMGIGQALLGNFQKAKSELSAVTSPAQRGNALAFLGYVAMQEQDQPRAIALFEDALKSENLGIRWQAQTELAKLRIQQGQFREAEIGLREALAENSQNDLGRYLLGISLHSLGRANEALNEFETLSRGQGDYSAQGSVQAASIRLLLGDIDSAERAISTARRSNYESPAYFTVLGRVHMATNLTSDARNAFDTAIRMDPTYAPAYLERGLLSVKEDNLTDGIRDLNDYLNLLGRDTRGTKANEIRLLTNQLQRAIENDNG